MDVLPVSFKRLAQLAVLLPSLLYASAVRSDDGGPMTIVAFGDSLTAGFGVDPDASFPAQLQAFLESRGLAVEVKNAGVSGDTTSGARSRLGWVLASLPPDEPDLIIVELGGNDALRGIDPALTRENMDDILAALQARGTPVLLAGMLAPPNLGEEYGREFNGIFPELADAYGVAFYPFFLDGVAAEPDLNQPDGIHPNRAGVAVIVDRIGPLVARLLAR